MATSPTQVQEKDELRHLNDRLANYIQRVMKLENERSSLHLLLGEKEESTTLEMDNIRGLYEEELADARKSMDELSSERARLQFDYGNLSEEHAKLTARNQKKESDLAYAVSQWRNLEAALNSKEADYSNQLAKNRKLTSDVTELHTQIEQTETVLADTKNQLNTEMVSKVEMDNQMQTLKQQLDFQKKISEQEVHALRSQHESLMEMDSGRRREFESKLAEAMHELRQEHDLRIQQYKEELGRNFSAKLENTQQTALRQSDADSATKDELNATKVRMDTLTSQLQQYQKEKGTLESRVRELDRTMDMERERFQQRLSQKEQEMLNIQGQLRSHLDEYQSLLDIKLGLDMEIKSYRKMLEGEEQRLQMSPSISQHAPVSQLHSQGVRRMKRKRMKNEDDPWSTPAYVRPSTHLTAHGPVSIAEIDVGGNYVILKNNSEEEQNLGGWVVKRTHPDLADVSFHIPPSCFLQAGQTLTIWAAGAEMEADPENLVMQGIESWGPVTDVRVVLLSPNHEETAERRVTFKEETDDEEWKESNKCTVM